MNMKRDSTIRIRNTSTDSMDVLSRVVRGIGFFNVPRVGVILSGFGHHPESVCSDPLFMGRMSQYRGLHRDSCTRHSRDSLECLPTFLTIE